MSEQTTLYRHFDAAGDLLYVGISLDHAKRTRDHSLSAKWFDDIANVTVEHFATRELAVEYERSAIENEKPKFNIVFGEHKKETISSAEFRQIRQRLGMTQAQLALFLEYGSPMRISEFERVTNPRTVPRLLALVMQALDAGWRP